LPAVLDAVGSLQIDPAAGNVLLAAVDCDGHPAPGVSFRLTQPREGVTALYLEAGVVSATAGHTDSTGIGGLIRVPPGFVQVVGTNGSSQVGEIGLQTAPSMLTYGVIVPAPPP